jgi:hypothetical protein
MAKRDITGEGGNEMSGMHSVQSRKETNPNNSYLLGPDYMKLSVTCGERNGGRTELLIL